MEKYKEMIKDIATLIADTDRENFLLKCQLEETQKQLAAAEQKLAQVDAYIATFEGDKAC